VKSRLESTHFGQYTGDQAVQKNISMTREVVTIKGTGTGLVITLGKGPLQTVLDELESHLNAKASFFVGGRVALRVGERPLSLEQLEAIGTLLEDMGVSLWAVESNHPGTLAAVRELGLETELRPPPAMTSGDEETIPLEEMQGIVVRRTLRSGQTLYHPGHITLVGDVNPGAEIVAGGDIVVWGKLLGTAHAGAMGEDGAIICALQLAPSQIRIGTHIARSPERSRRPKVPEVASIEEEGIVVERWNRQKFEV
jgi:septum site-determining protein MinC